MANGRSDGGTGNTAIVAIVVLVLVAVVVFMIFFWNGGNTFEEPAEGPDVELEVTPPEESGDATTEEPTGGAEDNAGSDEGTAP